MEYLDFDVKIDLGSGRDYPVAVVHSPAGEASDTMRFPFDELALENRLQALQIALLRSGGKRRRVLSQEEQTVREFGDALFQSLFIGEMRSRYDVSRNAAAQQGKGLRLKLRINAPELAAIPWEFLYDTRDAEYVCLSRHTPIVRYLQLSRVIAPLTVAPPLRVLGMIVSPRDLRPLDVESERQRIENALARVKRRGLVTLTWLEGQSWRDLQEAMRRGPWHVFHFIGHGGFDRNADEGVIALAEDGEARLLLATELGRLLADHQSLRLVLLNACEGAQGSKWDVFSSTAAILVRRGIPAVLAMQYEITDHAAIEFAQEFYKTIAEGLPVDTAVGEARKAVSLAVTNTVEWGTPVLYMRSPNGVLFNVETPVPLPPPSKPAPKEQQGPPVLGVREEPEAVEPRIGEVRPPAPPQDRGREVLLEEITNSIGMQLVLIPAGEFLMGAEKGGGSARPVRRVQISQPFYLGKYPVTQAQWKAVMGNNPSYFKGWFSDKPKHLVERVSWEEVQEFLRRLSEREKGKPYRLPTEAEWEYAARAGTTTAYHFGDDAKLLDEYAWYTENSGNTTHPVGR